MPDPLPYAALGRSFEVRVVQDVADASEPDALLDKALLERYFLRGVLWCGLCDRPLVPVLVDERLRYYACSNKRCARSVVPAEVVEQRVWERFMRLNEVFGHGVPRDRRYVVLREVLQRVVVGESTVDLRAEWRD